MPVPNLPTAPDKGSPAGADLASMLTPTKFEVIGADVRLPIEPNRPFFLRHHPANWFVSQSFEDGVFFLPEVTMMVIEPGVNGVRTRDKNEPPEAAYEAAVYASEKKGWTYISPTDPIPEGCLPPGVPPGGYLRELPCRDPLTLVDGFRYVEAWNVPVATLPEARQRFAFHHPSYQKWLRWLVEAGIIATITGEVIEEKRARFKGHVDRWRTLNIAPDIRAEFVAQKQAILDASVSAKRLEVLEGGDGDGVPRRKRSRA